LKTFKSQAIPNVHNTIWIITGCIDICEIIALLLKLKTCFFNLNINHELIYAPETEKPVSVLSNKKCVKQNHRFTFCTYYA